MRRRTARWLAIIALPWLLGGCATVSSWEREVLASPRMALDDDPNEASMVITRVRTREEGRSGVLGAAGGGTGGGCGCN